MPANLWKCPDCAQLVPIEETKALVFPIYGAFIECQRCGVGSQASKWAQADGFDLGMAAHAEGKGYAANPFPVHTNEWHGWEAGLSVAILNAGKTAELA